MRGLNKSQFTMKQFQLDLHIQGCKNNNRASQEAIYRYFSSKMFALCMRYTNDRMEAEDILQDGFVKLFTKIHHYTGEGHFEGWVRSIMLNTALTNYRANQRRVKTTDIELGDYSSYYQTSSDATDNQYLLDSLKRLPANYRVAFNLFAIEGYSHQEIADKTGITVLQSRTHVCRARTALRDNIKKAQMAIDAKLNRLMIA